MPDKISRITINIKLFIFIILLFISTSVYSQDTLKEKVILDLIGGKFEYNTKEARLYVLEYIDIFVTKVNDSIESITDSEEKWLNSELEKINKLEGIELVNAVTSRTETPVFIQYRVKNIKSNYDIAKSKIKDAKSKHAEAYWWAVLSHSLMPYQESDNWAEIISKSGKSYVPIDKLRPNISIISKSPSIINLILIKLLQGDSF